MMQGLATSSLPHALTHVCCELPNSPSLPVLRFTNLEILENLDGVIQVISQSVRRRITSP
jgi:hypothetical protein